LGTGTYTPNSFSQVIGNQYLVSERKVPSPLAGGGQEEGENDLIVFTPTLTLPHERGRDSSYGGLKVAKIKL